MPKKKNQKVDEYQEIGRIQKSNYRYMTKVELFAYY